MLDIEQPDALTAYLRDTNRIAADEQPEIRVLPGGVSNRTVFVRRANGDAWVLKQALAKLRVAVDWFSPPERVHREASGLRWLERLAPAGALPQFVFEDFEQHILAMTAVPEPHENWKTMLLRGDLHADHVRQFGHLLGSVHAQAAANAEIAAAFEDRSFFESLRVEPYYEYTVGQVAQAADFIHALIAETRATRITLVHGDYSPKNILVHHDRLILLDHEVIHWGDPAFDVGFSMTHLLSKAHHLPERRADFAAAALNYWQTYAPYVAAWEMEGRAVRHTLACLLARVAGRSPLEYLDAGERERQKRAVLALMTQPPETMAELIATFVERVSTAQV